MRHIGRKIYIHWGDRVLAIEQIFLPPAAMDLSEDSPISIADIYDVLGERVEKFVGPPKHPAPVGRTLTDYLTGGYWVADGEID